MNTQTQTNTIPQPHDEMILVVKRSVLFPEEPAWQGMKALDMLECAQLIHEKKEFHPRSIMETDAAYKQIIPYLIFTHDNRYFLMQRRAKASESRLQNKFSLGIGGHINQQDLLEGTIADWARREFEEEVSYQGNFTIEPIGILNDDSNAVGEVHVGFVYLLHGDSADISIMEEHKSGQLLSLDECMAFYDSMETWSQIAIKFLKNR